MDNRPSVNILWLKRDLRLHDHAPLKAAIDAGKPLLLLYFFEPSVLADPNYDRRHWRFVTECLADLQAQLLAIPAPSSTSVTPTFDAVEWLPFIFEDAAPDDCVPVRLGEPKLWVFHREVVEILTELQQLFTIDTLFSHEETGLKVTFDRDKAVSAFCQANGVNWREFQTNGVIRRLKNRDTWPADWQRTMKSTQQHPDLTQWQPADLLPDWYDNHRGEAVPDEWSVPDVRFQPGGEVNAHRYMHSFVTERVALYSKSISKPLESRRGCSRLSPYLAWGCLSIRQVYQAQLQAKEQVGFRDRPVRGAFNAFASRLRWHCHFIQKFETEDRMEFENVNRGFDALDKNVNPAHYRAWETGHTGYPMVDACMRCLNATGYINFRMRAMLTSFLAHHLFQHWQEGGWHLARVYTDFEPGIHYAQIQMQAGMTGTNTVRIYNPVKQSQDHDPEGIFIKQWIPELQNCPVAFIHEPWTLSPLEQTLYKFHPGVEYPLPIIDIAVTGRDAKLKLYSQRKTDVAKQEKERILKKHAIPRTVNDFNRKQAAKSKTEPKTGFQPTVETVV